MHGCFKIILLLILIVPKQAGAAEFYIAPSGSDANPGTKESPFATLEHARDEIRALRRPLAERVTVWLRGGDYEMKQTFKLRAEDSGSTGCAIVYRAMAGEKVNLIGGRVLAPEGFVKIKETAPIWARLSPDARDQVWSVNLRSQGIDDYGKLQSRGDAFRRPRPAAALELSFADQPMTLARYPNNDFVLTENTDPGRLAFTHRFDPPPADIDEIFFGGYWAKGYSFDCIRGSIDFSNGRITLAERPDAGLADERPFFIVNAADGLDTAGEWWLDRTNGLLYIWPPKPLQSNRIVVSMLESELVSLSNVSNVAIQDITFESGRGWGMAIDRGSNLEIKNCTIRNMGQGGIQIAGGRDHAIIGTDISGCGEDGIMINAGDRARLDPCRHLVRDCRVHDCARWCRTSRPAIRIDGVGVRVEHNLVFNQPHYGIWYMGNDHVIEANEIRNVCNEAGEGGAIYCGFGWDRRGALVRGNFIHHIESEEAEADKTGVVGIYIDDCSSGDTIAGNILYAISGTGVLIAGGRDNLVKGNIFADCKRAVWIVDRSSLINQRPGDHWNLPGRIEHFNYKQPPWSTRYPELVSIMDNGFDEARKPIHNRVESNIAWRTLVFSEDHHDGAIKWLEQKENITNSDPLFMDEAAPDLTLKPESPALRLRGFEPIDFERIGPSR